MRHSLGWYRHRVEQLERQLRDEAASKSELYRELHQLHDVAALKRDFEKRLAEQQVRFDAELSKTHAEAGYVNALDVLHALADQKLVPHRIPPELLTAALNDPDITPAEREAVTGELKQRTFTTAFLGPLQNAHTAARIEALIAVFSQRRST